MKAILGAALVAAMAATPALAQMNDRTGSRPPVNNLDGRHQLESGRSPGAPLDRGPYSGDANRAYMGGGVVLEGAPGAPAPMPQAMPPAGGMGSAYGTTTR